MHPVDPVPTLVAIAPSLPCIATIALSVSGAGERVLHEAPIRRSEEPRPAVGAISRLTTTVNSPLRSDQ
jgi:hypothetical protein